MLSASTSSRAQHVGPATALLAALAALAGCSSPGDLAMAHCLAIFDYPEVQLLSPQPGATAVTTSTSILYYAGSQVNGEAVVVVPITLEPHGTATMLTTDQLPGPIATAPAEAATPSASSSQTFAVRLPPLAGSTTYDVFATENVGGCATGTMSVPIGAFTTR